MRRLVFFVFLIAFFLVGCSSHRLDRGRAFRLTAVDFSDLPGWGDDDLTETYPALIQSCQNRPRSGRNSAMDCMITDMLRRPSFGDIWNGN